ncbi:Glutathione s-transferase [Colletotrichum higginsianum IMI 349063]|uniref:Glutathione s-transferase n=1 Tax=Colletotrichum higginsianum (strain IMI 349063) TaxID=759273 RepID=A0A1B7YJV3_COLHI|nr:Glutathione s-transferase [Colletotrichum higginsianum IMI 349063]OBR12316.1 Glutathione s-transferase [Colletotrichum higginsianum IMI 349063]
MSSTEPVALYSHGTLSLGFSQLNDNRPKGHTPDPAKVAMILEELELSPVRMRVCPGPESKQTKNDAEWQSDHADRDDHRKAMVGLAVVKEESYVFIHPNRRLPALRGPVLGGSPSRSPAPLLNCLVETYKANGRVLHPSSPQQFLVKKQPCFQISRQGPYFGQLSWFKILYSEDVPSAKQR